MIEPLIEVKNVSKSYRIYNKPFDRVKQAFVSDGSKRYYTEFCAVNDVTFAVGQGEALGILGRNGAGKSTLLQMICGVLQPSSGHVAVSGKIAPLLELGTSFNPEFTGLENIELASSVLGLDQHQIRERRQTIVEFADIGQHIEQPVRTYSSGMYARLAFAVAAHVDADILIVDEILSVGDIRFTQKCMRYIRRFRERGTLLFVSHDIGAVSAICDRAVWLDRGRLVMDSTPRAVTRLYQTYMARTDNDETAVEFVRAANAVAPAAAAPAKTPPSLDGSASNDPAPARRPAAANGHVPTSTVSFGPFDPASLATGQLEIKVTDAAWKDHERSKTSQIRGGDLVSLHLTIRSSVDAFSIIVGFSVVDKTGQILFAWDTSRNADLPALSMAAGQDAECAFTFRFPYLTAGSYTCVLAVAEGTAEQAIQQHWILDVLPFEVLHSSAAVGLVGVPMERVDFAAR